jgi:hypothetical protein
MLVGRFRNPEAAFPAAQSLKFSEAVRPRHDPREAQGPAATGASGVKDRMIVGRLHRCCAHHHRDITSAAAAAMHGRPGGISLPWVGRGANCGSLLLVSLSFRGKLPPNHLCNEVVFIAQ